MPVQEFSEADPFQNHLDNQMTLLEGNKADKAKDQELPKDEQIRTNFEFEERYIGKARLDFEKEFVEKKRFNEKIELGTEEFKEYMDYLLENSETQKRAHICVTCWQYQGIGQKYAHLRLGHLTIFCYELKSEEQFLEYAEQHEKIITEADGKKFVEPFKAYQRKTPNMICDSFQTIGNSNYGYVPLVASNTVYMDELRKLMFDKFMVDQESLVREQALRNKEEFLLKKKNMNLVDEVMVGVIRAEKEDDYFLMKKSKTVRFNNNGDKPRKPRIRNKPTIPEDIDEVNQNMGVGLGPLDEEDTQYEMMHFGNKDIDEVDDVVELMDELDHYGNADGVGAPADDVDIYQYQDVNNLPADKALKNIKIAKQKQARLNQKYKNQQSEIIQVSMDSQQFKEFIKLLEEPDNHAKPRLPVCLTCWKFITENQKMIHMNNGHQCLGKMEIRSESRFIQLAKDWSKYSWDGIIQLFSPKSNEQTKEPIQPAFISQTIGSQTAQSNPQSPQIQNRHISHKSAPFLAAPLCPYNTIPNSSGLGGEKCGSDSQPVNHSNFAKSQSNFKQDMLSFGRLALGFKNESREKICQVLELFKDQVQLIERQQKEIGYKLKMLMNCGTANNEDDNDIIDVKEVPSQIAFINSAIYNNNLQSQLEQVNVI
eukprot:403354811